MEPFEERFIGGGDESHYLHPCWETDLDDLDQIQKDKLDKLKGLLADKPLAHPVADWQMVKFLSAVPSRPDRI